jgi:cation diffusion facilitator family transporter
MHAKQQNAAKLSLGANVFLVALKIGAGVLSGSLSVLAEGIQSLLDIVASALILISVRASAAPPDASHPYGHGKFENLSALAQMTLVLASVAGIWWAAWHRWHNPQPIVVDWGIGALLISVVVNLWVSARVEKVARETDSTALAAEAVHLRGDLWACAGVLGGLVATRAFDEPRLDPLFAGLMTTFAVVSAREIITRYAAPVARRNFASGRRTSGARGFGKRFASFRISQTANAPSGFGAFGRCAYSARRRLDISRRASSFGRNRDCDSRGFANADCHRSR